VKVSDPFLFQRDEMANFPIQTYDQKAVLAVALTFAILAFIAVCLRLIAHQIAHKKWMPSDYFIIAACVSPPQLATVSTTNQS
jgi:hypothetical protein